MEIKDSMVWLSVFFLIIVTVYTLYNIHQFMPLVNKCDPAFKIVNKCGCIPDKGIADIFHIDYKDYGVNLNFSVENKDGR